MGSVNQIVEIAGVEPTWKKKRIGDDSDDEPAAKKIWQAPSLTNSEDLRKNLRYWDERPFR